MDKGPFIHLSSGKRLYFLNPTVDQINVLDAAEAGSKLCRFGGHCNPFYSINEHAVRTSWLLPPDLQLVGLLHDMQESLGLCDILSPIKACLPQFRKLEHKLERVIALKYGLPYPHPKEVKIADLTILKREMKDLKKGSDWKDLPYPLLPDKIIPWDIPTAKRRFLARFHQLYKAK